MRVLHLNYGDLGHGGASVAAYRLHRSLTAAGARSAMRVASKVSGDPDVTVSRSFGRPRVPLRRALQACGLNELDGISPYLLPRDPAFRAADVIHCHALQGDWFSYPAVRLLARDKPVVLTLHDMWPMTGHCSFSFGCDRWQTGCGSCPHPDTYPAIDRDSTRLEWRIKRWTWAGAEPTVVCPSEWMGGLARRGMLGRCRVEVIPHGIDLGTYRPSDDRDGGRRALGIPPERVAILFAAASVDDPRKGGDVLVRLARGLGPVRDSVCIVVMGAATGPWPGSCGPSATGSWSSGSWPARRRRPGSTGRPTCSASRREPTTRRW